MTARAITDRLISLALLVTVFPVVCLVLAAYFVAGMAAWAVEWIAKEK